MHRGGLYESTLVDFLLDGFALVGLGLWLLCWFIHIVALTYARKALFADAKQVYLEKKAKTAVSVPKPAPKPRSVRKQRFTLSNLFPGRSAKLNDSNRYVKLVKDPSNDSPDESLLDLDSTVLESAIDVKPEVDVSTLSQSSAESDTLPGVSIIKPVCGVDAMLKDNLESYFRLDYPRFELLFCVHNETDPAVEVVRELMAKYQNVDASLQVGAKWVGVNPKINNMQQGYERAKYELVLISDSGILTQSDTLTQLVYTMLSDDRNGIVHQLPFINLDVYSQIGDETSEKTETEPKPTSKPDCVPSQTADRPAQRKVAFLADVEHRKVKSICSDDSLVPSAEETRRPKASHKHSFSVDLNASVRSVATSRFALQPQRSYDAQHEEVRERSAQTQSDWAEVDLQLNESINSAQMLRAALQRKAAAKDDQPQIALDGADADPKLSETGVDDPLPHVAVHVSSTPLTLPVVDRVDTSVPMPVETQDISAVRKLQSNFSAFVAAVHVAYFGAQHARLYLCANALGFNCVNGMSTLIRKRALDACGGLHAFAHYLAEDYFIAQRLVAAGYRTPLCSRVALQNTMGPGTGPMSVRQFEARFQRWYILRISMLPHTIFLDPCSEVLPIGVFASWSLVQLFDCALFHPLTIFLLHALVWFFLDYLLIQTVARSARVRSSHSTMSGSNSNGSTQSDGGENAYIAYTGTSKATGRRLLPFSKMDMLTAWLYRESTSWFVQLCALPKRYIVWRNKVYRVRWGGRTEQVA